MLKKIIYSLLAFGFALNELAYAAKPETLNELIDSSIATMLEAEVTSVSKDTEKVFNAPAAIHVITNKDIKRSGLKTIPEILRLAPGVHVAQITSNKWAISTRGFSDQLATKLLVLIDGRSIYTPLFAGVNWDVHDTLIEDIDRIEVIRGPGGSLWGANAVNGVINIITKSAKDTQDALAVLDIGNGVKSTKYRVGGKQENLYYRVYAQKQLFDESKKQNDIGAEDDWDSQQAGFKLEWADNNKSFFSLQGDAYDINEDRILDTLPIIDIPFIQNLVTKEERSGANIIFNLNHKHSSSNESNLKIYFDHVVRDNPATLKQNRYAIDVDYEHDTRYKNGDIFTWGAGYRYTEDNLKGSVYLDYNPEEDAYSLYNAFVQYKKFLIPEKLFLVLGNKFEYNTYTGMEYQPSIRGSWELPNKSVLWGSVSQSVRTPSRSSADVSVVVANLKPGFVRWEGNDAYKSEKLTSYEIGYRKSILQNFDVDIAGYYNDYTNLRTFEAATPFMDQSTAFADHTVIPLYYDNLGNGESYGFELSADWMPTSSWQMSASYTYNVLNIGLDPASTDSILEDSEGKNPTNQFLVRSHYVSGSMALDSSLYFVDKLNAISVPSYWRLDSQITFKPKPNLNLIIGGQNLLSSRHQEFSAPLHSSATEVARSVFIKLILKL